MDRRRWIFLSTAAFALAFDQLTKVWARRALQPIYPHTKALIPRYWEFRYSENPGAAFGLLRDIPGAHYLFIVVALGIAVGAFFWVKRPSLAHPLRVAAELGLVVGGAVGNAIDRLAFGRVTDFIVWKVGGTWEWQTFNVADAALVVGIIGLVHDSGTPRPKAKPARA